MKTLWRPIPGWEGLYSVTASGKVRPDQRIVERSNGVKQTVQARVLATSRNKHGYEVVHLYRSGERTHMSVHVAVALAWVGEPPFKGAEVRHMNGDRLCNVARNLVWGTQSENTLDRVRHGTHHNTNKTHCPHGHEYTPENTYHLDASHPHWRWCKQCLLERQRQ